MILLYNFNIKFLLNLTNLSAFEGYGFNVLFKWGKKINIKYKFDDKMQI